MDEFDPKKAATDLVAAFVSNNSLAAEQLPDLLASVYAAVTAFGAPVEETPAAESYVPKVSPRASTRDPNFIVSLITGEKLKTLKRHLSRHGLTPAEYRERYNLSRDYPMVAPTYSQHRRAVAQRLGLGRRPAPASPPPVPEAVAEVRTDTPPVAPSNAPAAVKAPVARKARTAVPTASTAPVHKNTKKAGDPTPVPAIPEKPTRGRKLSPAFTKSEAPVVEPVPSENNTTAPKRRTPAKAKTVAAPEVTPALPAKTPVRRSRKPK